MNKIKSSLHYIDRMPRTLALFAGLTSGLGLGMLTSLVFSPIVGMIFFFCLLACAAHIALSAKPIIHKNNSTLK